MVRWVCGGKIRAWLQVVAVVAHELGHWKLGHTVCLMATQSAIMLAQFVLFAVFRSSGHLLRAFGFDQERPVIVALMLFMMVIGPIDSLVGWCFNLLSRRCAAARWVWVLPPVFLYICMRTSTASADKAGRRAGSSIRRTALR